MPKDKPLKFWTPKKGLTKITILQGPDYSILTDEGKPFQIVSPRGSVPCYSDTDMSRRWDVCPICRMLLQGDILLYGVTTA